MPYFASIIMFYHVKIACYHYCLSLNLIQINKVTNRGPIPLKKGRESTFMNKKSLRGHMWDKIGESKFIK